MRIARTAWLCMLCALVAPCVARAATPERYEVHASLSSDRETLEVRTTISVRVDEDEEELRFWLYGARLEHAPAILDERTWRWIYPGDRDDGSVVVDAVTVDAARVEAERLEGEGLRAPAAAGVDLRVALPPGPARVVTVSIHTTTRLPARFGRMGRDGGRVSLAAPWYPLVVVGDTYRFDEAVHSLSFVTQSGEVWAPGAAPARQIAVERAGPYVPVQVADRIHVRSETRGGTELVWVSDERPYQRPPAHAPGLEGLEDPLAIDRVGLAWEVLQECLVTLRWLGIPAPPRVVILQTPTRAELAATAPGVVLVSDRWAEIFPIDLVREFHTRALRRAIFQRAVEALLLDGPADRDWADDLRSVVLLDLDELRRSHRSQRPDELLSLFAFHPAVDQLLYAPQVAFEDAYFGAIDEPDPYRDHPARARFPYVRGRRLLESARDHLGAAPARRFVAALARARESVREVLARLDPEALTRLPGWVDYPAREVNYRLGEIASERLESGAYRHTIEIFRDGDARPEPVEVEVQDAQGARVTGVWFSDAPRGQVVLETAAERGEVRVDPRHRLPQSASVADGHPRADDATSQPLRPPILNGFTLDFLGSEGNVTGLLNLAIRERYGLDETWGVRLSRTAARTGGQLLYYRHVGDAVHTNRRLGYVAGGLSLNYVDPNFGGTDVGGWASSIVLLGGLDTRSYIYDPREGYSLGGSLLGTLTAREDGSLGLSLRAAVRATATYGLGLLHVLMIAVGGGFTAGPALPADRQALGGRDVLRGFANDELLGNGAMYAVVEHRWTAVTDLALNFFHIAWVREIQAVWWAGVGVAFDTPAGFEAQGAFEAGAGLRAHYEYGGIQPGVIALDVGLPISRWAQGEFASARRPPVGFYISFDQYF